MKFQVFTWHFFGRGQVISSPPARDKTGATRLDQCALPRPTNEDISEVLQNFDESTGFLDMSQQSAPATPVKKRKAEASAGQSPAPGKSPVSTAKPSKFAFGKSPMQSSEAASSSKVMNAKDESVFDESVPSSPKGKHKRKDKTGKHKDKKSDKVKKDHSTKKK